MKSAPIFYILLLAVSFGSSLGRAGGLGASGGELRRFGPYEAIAFNPSIVNDVKVNEKGEVWLQLKPDFRERELRVKLSNDYFASYREWSHGGYELISPANQGKQPYAWTDWVVTQATYIEYWMDGEVFLHLKRVS